MGNGDGTFQPAVGYAAGGGANSAAVADFNGDGKPDLAVANPNFTGTATTSTVTVLLGNGDGGFHEPPGYPPQDVGALALADFNGDGKLDVAVGVDTDAIAVLLGNGNGTFQPPVTTNIPVSPGYIAVGDFNGDGKPDLAVTAAFGSSVAILLSNGNGAFQPAVTR